MIGLGIQYQFQAFMLLFQPMEMTLHTLIKDRSTSIFDQERHGVSKLN